ncbi:hypothetical protein RB653_004609 [Dictyostelium firmibasis]|uniref:DNA polymerase II subunit 2 n=1 Tax=Dictyostelium firmibasis TaxID=79012 RepID=A0AAN7TZX9_9MYCE
MDIQWKKQITKSFSLTGFSIKADAMKCIINRIKNEGYDITQLIENLLKNLDKSQLNNNIIDLQTIEGCFKLIDTINSSDAIEKEALKVIDAFNTPLFNFDSNSKQFIKCENFDRSLHGSSNSKSDLYRKRYLKVLQRTERNEYFAAPVLASDKLKNEYQTITPLSSLLGNTGRKHVLGTISQIEEDQFYLEDLNTHVKIDISKAKFEFGIVTINSIIQASGEFIDGIFIADKIQLPPTEERCETLKFLQNIDLFGEKPQKKTMEQLIKYEKEKEDNSILFLSDVWLDSERVMERLDYLFGGYKDCPPFAMILMGNFTEHPLINGTQYQLKKHFNDLATIIQKYPNIHQFTQFIFVPGPTDPTGSLLNILPKFPISNVFIKEFQSVIQKSIFTTNPCRIRYCSQEIIVFRDDLTNKMRRHCILEPSQSCDISQHLIELICSNSHLCNLTLEDKPIYWNYDHAMSVYPLPDILVIGDKSNQYEHSRADGTYSMNPSSFSTDYSFAHYIPSSKQFYYNKADRPSEEFEDEDEEEQEEQEEDEEKEEEEEAENNDKIHQRDTQDEHHHDETNEKNDEIMIDENEKQKSKKRNKKVIIITKEDELNKLEDDEEILNSLDAQKQNENDNILNEELSDNNDNNIEFEVQEVEKEEDEDEEPIDNDKLDEFIE